MDELATAVPYHSEKVGKWRGGVTYHRPRGLRDWRLASPHRCFGPLDLFGDISIDVMGSVRNEIDVRERVRAEVRADARERDRVWRSDDASLEGLSGPDPAVHHMVR